MGESSLWFFLFIHELPLYVGDRYMIDRETVFVYSDVWIYKFIQGSHFFKPVPLFSQSIGSSIGEVGLSATFTTISIHYTVLVTFKATFPKLTSST